ncbi:MAG: glycosyltransferase family 1 protein [Kofleriaceae bacterium]
MRVLFDHQIFSYQRFGGASRYYHELIHVFHATPGVEVALGVAVTPNEYLAHASYYRGRVTRAGGAGRFLATYARNELATWRAARVPHDVLHTTFYDPRAARHRGTLVVTVLDMIPEHFPGDFAVTGLYGRLVTKRWIEGKRTLCERADKILAISETTKQDVVRLFGIDPARITVTHLGNRLRFTGGARPLEERYVLFVGTRNTYKNFGVFVAGLAGLDVTALCIGGGPFDAREQALLAEHGVHAIQRSVRDDELAACYAHAAAFVFPSRYEGFGIPILEAFACGAPAILARASCFPEIAGDAALYFAPDSVDELRAALRAVLDEPAAAEALRAKGRARAAGFTWEATAAATLAAYAEARA